MTETKFCPFGEGHLAPVTFFNRDASRKTGLAAYCRRHASEKSHPNRNRHLSGTCDECGQPARTNTCPDCLWAERMIQESCDTRGRVDPIDGQASKTKSDFRSNESIFQKLSMQRRGSLGGDRREKFGRDA